MSERTLPDWGFPRQTLLGRIDRLESVLRRLLEAADKELNHHGCGYCTKSARIRSARLEQGVKCPHSALAEAIVEARQTIGDK